MFLMSHQRWAVVATLDVNETSVHPTLDVKETSVRHLLPKNNKNSTLLHHTLAAKVNHNFSSHRETMS